RSGSISTLISTFADIDRRIRTHGHSEINKGLERLLTCTQCYLVGRKRKRGRKGKGNGKYRKSEKFIEHGRIAKGVQIALQKSLPVDANTASAAIGVQHPDLPSGVAPFEHIPSDTPPLIITASDIIKSAKKQASLSYGGLSGIPSDVWRSVLMDKASTETFAFMSTYFVSNPSVLPNFLSSKVFALRKPRSTNMFSTQSYRTIAMAEIPLRILHRAILAKIGAPCHPCQCGDGVPDGALKAAYHVLLCIALCDQTQKPIRILQIDSSNAFNTLSKNFIIIMESLRRKNVNSTLQNYISFFLSNQPRYVVNKDGSLTRIVSPRGAPQGDCLSMKLYNVSVDDIIQEVCCNFDSISVEIDGHSLTLPPVVFYADDMTLMTQSDNITEILDFVRSRLRARLFDVKPSKCLFFSNREDDSTPMIDDTPITRYTSNTLLQAGDTLVSSGSGFIVSSPEHRSWIKFQLRHWADSCLTSQSEINPDAPSPLGDSPVDDPGIPVSSQPPPQSSAPRVNQTSPGPVDSATHLSPAEEDILDFLEWAEEQEADDTTGYTLCPTFENPLSSVFTKPGVKKYKHQLHEASFNSLVLSLRNTIIIITAHEADMLIDPEHIDQDTADLLRTRAQGTRASLQLLSFIAASDPSNIFSSLLKTVFGRLLNAPSFRMMLADRYGYLCPGICVTEKCSHCGSQLDFVSSTNHSRVCRSIRSNIIGRHDELCSLSAAWLEEVLGLPITREDTRFLRHLNPRTQRADIVAHAFGTSDWSRNLVFDTQITEVISTKIILDFTRRIAATGNSVTGIVELGREIIHACLARKESNKRSEYTPNPPPGSEIDPRYSFDFYPMIFSSTGIVGESFQEFLALVQRHHSSRCIEELKVVLARSLAYGNALNRQSYELRCSGHATSETI
ncbi:hypothetical protein ADUPG1_002964, partial [Aduncisulcus paluster]